MEKYRFDDQWLRDRITLFKHYTYPSVKAQTDQRFKWTGVVHKDSPRWFLDELHLFERIKIVEVERDTDIENPNDVTVNLDSDDALSRYFIKEAKARRSKNQASYFEVGTKCRISTGAFIRVRSNTNPFTIVPAGEHTVFDYSHGTWPDPYIMKNLPTMWLQTIHTANIDNRLKKPRQTVPSDYSNVSEYFEINPLPAGETDEQPVS